MTPAKRRDLVFWSLLLLIALAYFLWQWHPVHQFAWKFDEGINAMKARLLLAGYSLYGEIWSDQAPLFTMLLAAAFAIFGQSVLVGRALVLALAGLAIVATGWIGRHMGAGPEGRPQDRLAGLVAVGFLVLLPHFCQLSTAILIGLPAISVGLTAMAAAYAHQVTGKMHWLALSGGLFGLSLLIKPITAPLYVPLSALAFLGRHGLRATLRERMRSWAMFSAMAAIPLAFTLALLDSRAFLNQVVGTFVQARGTQGLPLAKNLAEMGDYFFSDRWGLSYAGPLCLSAVGLLSITARRCQSRLVPLGLWLVSTLLALLLHSPLRRHELFLTMPVFAVLAGLGTQRAITGLGTFRSANASERLLSITGSLAVILAATNLIPLVRTHLAIRSDSLVERQESPTHRQALRFLETRTPPESMIITDDPMLAFKSRRLIPPILAVPSFRRVEAGGLSSAFLTELTEEVRPSAILLWEQRLSRAAEYSDWVASSYCVIRAYPHREWMRWIYVPCDPAEIAFPQPASTREGIAFLGSSVTRLGVDPGDSLGLALYLRAQSAIDQDHTLFVHFLDTQGNSWGQVDQQPFGGQYSTSQWRPGQTLIQEIVLPVRSDAPPGEKMLAVGFYDAQVRRLPLYDPQGHPLPDGQLILTPRPVVRWQAQFDLPTPLHQQEATLGGYVRFLGYDLDDEPVHPGDAVTLTLYWQCLSEMHASYTVFTHLLNAQGDLVAQRDQVPGEGAFPTTGWRTGEVITDPYHILLPQDLSSGTYHVGIGMYELATGMRLPLSEGGGSTPEGRLLLTESIEVAPQRYGEER